MGKIQLATGRWYQLDGTDHWLEPCYDYPATHPWKDEKGNRFTEDGKLVEGENNFGDLISSEEHPYSEYPEQIENVFLRAQVKQLTALLNQLTRRVIDIENEREQEGWDYSSEEL